MNVINSTVLRNNLSDSLKEIETKKRFLLVAKRGKVTSALVNLDLFEDLLEIADSKYLQNRAFRFADGVIFLTKYIKKNGQL